MSSLLLPPRIIIFIFLLFAQHSLQAEGVVVLVLIFILLFGNYNNTDDDHSNTRQDKTFQILECDGPLNPEVVHSTAHGAGCCPASNVLILGEEDAYLGNEKTNVWIAEFQKTTGQGFTLRLDDCTIGLGENANFSISYLDACIPM